MAFGENWKTFGLLDGHPRAAVVKVFREERQATFIQIPVQKLCPVELTEKQITEDSYLRVRRRTAEQALIDWLLSNDLL